MSAASGEFRAAIRAALPDADVPEAIKPGRLHRFGTSGRRGDSAGWCKLFDDMRGGVFGCHRQQINETWSAADRATMTREQRAELARQVAAATAERQAQQRQQCAENARRNAAVWAQCAPALRGDLVSGYLDRRGFRGLWPLPQVLRLHRALPYWHNGEKLGTFPAMVTPIIAPDGRTVALHRTYLTGDGRKADVPTVKKVTGAAGPLAGACIPLYKPMRRCIGIAEGIETALAAYCASAVPTVAAYSAGNLAAWQWPHGVQRLVIFADADKAGRDAAGELYDRASAAGLRAEVLTPSTDGTDWADVFAARDSAEVAT